MLYLMYRVIQTAKTAGEYVLGFRIDPQDRLHEMYKEISSLHAIYSETPIFGVNYEMKMPVINSQLLSQTISHLNTNIFSVCVI